MREVGCRQTVNAVYMDCGEADKGKHCLECFKCVAGDGMEVEMQGGE